MNNKFKKMMFLLAGTVPVGCVATALSVQPQMTGDGHRFRVEFSGGTCKFIGAPETVRFLNVIPESGFDSVVQAGRGPDGTTFKILQDGEALEKSDLTNYVVECVGSCSFVGSKITLHTLVKAKSLLIGPNLESGYRVIPLEGKFSLLDGTLDFSGGDYAMTAINIESVRPG
jgi:hypothetical protein